MKQINIRLVIYVILSSVLFAQKISSRESNAIFLPQGFVNESLSSNGVYNNEKSVFNISSENPIGIMNFDNISFGFAFQYESKIDDAWMADIGYKRYTNLLPQSMGIVLPLKYFNIGYGFSQSYNAELIFQPMEIFTSEYPEGINEFITPIDRIYVFSNSILIAKQFDHKSVKMNIGFRFSNFNMNEYNKIGNIEETYKDNANGYAIGFGICYNKNVIISTFYEMGSRFSKKYYYDSIGLEPNEPFLTENTIIGNFPNNLNTSIVYNYTNQIKIIGSIKFNYWSKSHNYYRDQIDLSCNIEKKVKNNHQMSIGFYVNNGNFNKNIDNKSFRAIYLIGGLNYQTKYIDVDLTLADSQILSGAAARKQTIGKIGLGFHL